MKEKRGFSDQVGLGWMDSIPSCNEEEDDDDDQSKYFFLRNRSNCFPRVGLILSLAVTWPQAREPYCYEPSTKLHSD
jgi:hypothetical protein